MSSRFERDFELRIGLGDSGVIINPPFNISFSSVENVINKSLNKLNINIPGLNESTRQKLIKYESDRNAYLPVEFFVGYKGKKYRAFKGSLRIGELDREGALFINKLECYDGHPDFTQSFTSRTVSGTQTSIDAILEDMPNTEKGAISPIQPTLRPKVLVGSSSELLSKIAGNKEFYIKDQKIFMLNSDEVVSSVAPLVNAKTGLKTTPKPDKFETTFTTVLNPTLKIGGLCAIESTTNPTVNGVYKIYQIQTNGSYKGAWEQTVSVRPLNKYRVIR